MLLLGAKDITDLKNVSYLLKGELGELVLSLKKLYKF